MQDMQQIEGLQQMAIFGGIPAETIEFLLAGARMLDVAEGSYLMREGDIATGLDVLLSGRVAVHRRWRGSDILLRHLGPGDCFGEMALLDLRPRSASVQAIERSRALEMGTELLHALFEHDARQFALMQMNIARELSRRLRLTYDQLFSASTPAERELVQQILLR